MRAAIHIAIATNRAFAMQAATLISSIVRVHGDDNYVIHVLHDGLDEEMLARIGAAAALRGDRMGRCTVGRVPKVQCPRARPAIALSVADRGVVGRSRSGDLPRCGHHRA